MGKYEEALERANEAVKRGMVSQNFVDDIFGVESEDERIRKDIINLIEFALKDGSAVSPGSRTTKEEALAYLEKLKEQKPAELRDSRQIALMIENGRRSGVIEGRKQVVDNPEEYGLCKPAEWSDTDNIGWDEAFACVTRAEKSAKNEEEFQNAVTAENWLKRIKFKYYVHPVKQEWSEEDEGTLDYIINVLDKLGFEEYCKSSRDQDVEEDRLYYKEIQVLKKLKSLRSRPKSSDNWKPSEEQMKELRKAKEMYMKSSSGIASLYYDLKTKLM